MGSRRYLLDTSTDILMMSWWIRSQMSKPALWWPGQPFPEMLSKHLANGGLLSGWKSIDFERIAWKHICVPRHDFPEVDDGLWRDSMHKAAAANLPRSLDGAARAVGAAVQKDKEGHTLMLRVTNKTRTPVIDPAELIRLGEYCIDDARTEAHTDDKIPEWPEVWPWNHIARVDRQINDRGVLMDVELVRGLARACDDEMIRLDAEIKTLTGMPKIKTSSIGQIKQWLLDQGVKLPLVVDLKAPPPEDADNDDELEKDEDGARDTLPRYRMRKSDIADILGEVESLLKGRNSPSEIISESLFFDRERLKRVKAVLEMRAEAAKASVKKLKAMLLYADPDGRLRQCLILMGAQGTGRWSGAGYQPHNFPRIVIANDNEGGYLLEGAIYDGREGDADNIRSLWGNVLPWASKMLRRCLCAPVGRTLLQGDYAQVEARITAWLSGQQNIIDAFANGKDVYRIAASPIFGILAELLTKEQRQIGKVAVLGLGFGGGVNVFTVMAMAYGIRISREEADPIVKAWRKANPQIVQYWRDLEEAIRMAVFNPGKEYRAGITGLVSYFVQNNCLFCRLPSGRFLRYWAPVAVPSYWPDGNPRGWEVTFLKVKGPNVFRAKLYGGLAVENQAQAIAADLLAGGLVRLSDAGFEVVLHVHDSIAAEIDEAYAEAALPEFKRLMAQPEIWSRGLPLAADCHIGSRFG